jgi:hypothetical protein
MDAASGLLWSKYERRQKYFVEIWAPYPTKLGIEGNNFMATKFEFLGRCHIIILQMSGR